MRNNRAFDQGGGLDVDELEDNLTIEKSTFSGNSATNEGGGIYSGLDDVAIHNSTIVNNTASAPPAVASTRSYDDRGRLEHDRRR